MTYVLIGVLVIVVGVALAFGISALVSWFFSFLYFIAKWLLTFLDFCQVMFRKLVGLDTVQGASGDIVTVFINEPAVQQAFWAIMVVSVAMVFIFGLIQIIRLQYTTEGAKNAVGPIIKTCLKSLFLFGLIPVCSILGIYVCNMLVGLVDKASNGGNKGAAESIAGMVFVAAAHDANPWRALANGEEYPVEWVTPPLGDLVAYRMSLATGGLISSNVQSYDEKRGLIEYADGTSNKGKEKVYDDGSSILGADVVSNRINSAKSLDDAFRIISTDAYRATGSSNNVKAGDLISYTNQDAVYFFYNQTKINYVILFAGAYFCMSAMINTMFGLAMRMYRLAALFMISPYPVAMTVLDNGQSLGKWKQLYIQNLFSSYGTIVAMNFIFLLIPVIDDLTFFDGSGWLDPLYNILVRMILVIVACLMIKDIAGMLSGFFGGGNAMQEGEGMSKEVGAIAAKVGTTAMGGLMAAGAAAKFVGGAVGKGVNSIKAGMATRAAKRKDKSALKQDQKAGDKKAEAEEKRKKAAELRQGLEDKKNKIKELEQQARDEGVWSDNLNRPDLRTKRGSEIWDQIGQIQSELDEEPSVLREADRLERSAARSDSAAERKTAAAGKKRKGAAWRRSFADKKNAKVARYQTSQLRSKTLLSNMVKNSKVGQYINQGTMGMLTKEGRSKLYEQSIKENEGYETIQRDADYSRQYTKNIKDYNGNTAQEGIQLSGRKHISKATQKYMAHKINTESADTVGKNVDPNAYNNALEMLKKLFTTLLNDKNMAGMTREGFNNLEAQAQQLIANGAFDDNTAKAMNDALKNMSEAFDHEKGSEGYDKAMAAAQKALKDSGLASSDGAGKLKLAEGSLVKIDPASIAKFQAAVKSGSLEKLGKDETLSKAMKNLIKDAITKATQQQANAKSDKKTDNALHELMRELINEVKRKK